MSKELLAAFLDEVWPWIQADSLTLHEAFEKANKRQGEILKAMWRSSSGRKYLKSKTKYKSPI